LVRIDSSLVLEAATDKHQRDIDNVAALAQYGCLSWRRINGALGIDCSTM
jgi:hypothetical protein